MTTIAHTQKCCGSCRMWGGAQQPVNPLQNPRTGTILIKCSEGKSVCYVINSRATLFSATQGCGQRQPMFG